MIDPLGNRSRIIDIRAQLNAKREARRRAQIKNAVQTVGVVLAAGLLIYFFWRGVWETFT